MQPLDFQQQRQVFGHPLGDRHAIGAPAAGGVAMQAGGAAEVRDLPAQRVQVGVKVGNGVGGVLLHDVILGYSFPFMCGICR